MQDRAVDRTDLEFNAAGIVKFFRKRDLVPVENRLAHVDRDRTVVMLDGIEDACHRLESEDLVAGFRGKSLHHATRAVAAGLRL